MNNNEDRIFTTSMAIKDMNTQPEECAPDEFSFLDTPANFSRILNVRTLTRDNHVSVVIELESGSIVLMSPQVIETYFLFPVKKKM